MRAPDPGAVAGYRRAMLRRGFPATIQRINGEAPRTSLVSAEEVPVMVLAETADTAAGTATGYGSGDVGGLAQDTRTMLVMVEDLAAARFPLPLTKNDRVLLTQSGELLNITDVDADKRALGGAIEIKVTGVS